MQIPEGSERLAFAGDVTQLPAPLSRRKIDIGYIREETNEEASADQYQNEPRVQDAEFTYLRVTHALPDRTFVYRALLETEYNMQASDKRTIVSEDVRALFVPNNKIKPNFDDGDWYFGRDQVLAYVQATGFAHGVLFVTKSAIVRWSVEGASRAQQLHHIVRPQISPRDASPIEFRGIYDCEPPECCDSD